MSRSGDAALRFARALRRQELARAAGWLVVGAAANRLITLVGITLASRILVPEAFGQVALVQSLALLAAGVAGLGLSVAVTRQVAEALGTSPDAAGRYIGATLVATGAAASIAALGILLNQGWLSSTVLGDSDLAALIPASAGVVFMLTLVGSTQASMTGLEAFGAVALLQVVQGLASSAGLVLGASASGPQGALTGLACGQAVAAGLGLALVIRSSRANALSLSPWLTREEQRVLARFAFPALVALVIVSAALLGGQLLLSRGPEGYGHVAEFSVAYRWHLALLFIPSAAVPALLPVLTRLTGQSEAKARRTLRLALISSLVIVALPAATAAVGARYLLQLNGDFYAQDTAPLIILAAAAIPCVVNNVLSSAALSLGKIRAWLLSDVVLAVGLLGLGLLLVPQGHASGLAVGYFVGYLLAALVLIPSVLLRLSSPARGRS